MYGYSGKTYGIDTPTTWREPVRGRLPGRAPRGDRARVFEYLKQRASGATQQEIADSLGMTMHAVNQELHNLQCSGMVEKHGTRPAKWTCPEPLPFDDMRIRGMDEESKE